VKHSAILHWLIGIALAAAAVGAAFYFDQTVWIFLKQHQNRSLHNFMLNVSRFGDWPWHVALGLLLLGTAWIRGSRKWSRVFLAMLIAMALAGIAGQVIKRTIPRARPSVHSDARWGGPRFTTKFHSFPSGHVGASTAFFGVLIIARRRVGLACLPIPILIGFSRMYVGAHYLSDVVCAAILGFLCAAVVCRLLLPNEHQTSNIEHRTSVWRRG
jgi:membrane-associated phospholipid phosphatase